VTAFGSPKAVKLILRGGQYSTANIVVVIMPTHSLVLFRSVPFYGVATSKVTQGHRVPRTSY